MREAIKFAVPHRGAGRGINHTGITGLELRSHPRTFRRSVTRKRVTPPMAAIFDFRTVFHRVKMPPKVDPFSARFPDLLFLRFGP